MPVCVIYSLLYPIFVNKNVFRLNREARHFMEISLFAFALFRYRNCDPALLKFDVRYYCFVKIIYLSFVCEFSREISFLD